MSHWNYDVVMYDSDAVVLKDPQSLFDSYPRVGLIGSTGKGPESIGRIWGRTICTGVLLMRSSPALGRLTRTPIEIFFRLIGVWIRDAPLY